MGPVMIQIGFTNQVDWVKVRVFTTAFRKVKEKTYNNVSAGLGNLTLDLSDNWGAPLANGIYFVLITTPDSKFERKLLILK